MCVTEGISQKGCSGVSEDMSILPFPWKLGNKNTAHVCSLCCIRWLMGGSWGLKTLPSFNINVKVGKDKSSKQLLLLKAHLFVPDTSLKWGKYMVKKKKCRDGRKYWKCFRLVENEVVEYEERKWSQFWHLHWLIWQGRCVM